MKVLLGTINMCLLHNEGNISGVCLWGMGTIMVMITQFTLYYLWIGSKESRR